MTNFHKILFHFWVKPFVSLPNNLFKHKMFSYWCSFFFYTKSPNSSWAVPVQRSHRRSQTRSAPWWRQSSCRRNSRGNDTFAGRTSGRARAGGAVRNGTERRSSRWPGRPGSPPDRRSRLQYEHLGKCLAGERESVTYCMCFSFGFSERFWYRIVSVC